MSVISHPSPVIRHIKSNSAFTNVGRTPHSAPFHQENRRNQVRLKNTAMALLSAAVIGGFMFAPQAAQAQWWERDRDRDRGRQDWNRDRNDRSRDRGDWDRGRVDRRHVERLINELERSSNTFRNAVERHRFDDRSIHSRYGRDERYRRDDSRGHDELKRMVQRMDESIEHLRRDFDR